MTPLLYTSVMDEKQVKFTARVDRELHMNFRAWLLTRGKKINEWVEEKMKEELSDTPKKPSK
jgi:predicted HicB family RNase H-like nuclease